MAYTLFLLNERTTPLLLAIPLLFIVTPMLVMLILSPLTIVKLYRQHTIRRNLSNQESSTGPYRTSILLSAAVVVYLLLAGTPYLVFSVISARGTNISTAIGSWGGIPRDSIVMSVMKQANYSTNLLSKEFRQYAFRILGCSCC